MPTITAQSIINKAKITIQDTTNVRWADSELLAYLNDGQREICMIRPDSCSVLANVTMVAGTKQSIPDAGTAVLRVVRNMGTGTTPGRAVRHIPMALLDANIPDWHASSPANDTIHAVVDTRMPQTFYVYPPANAGRVLEVLYSAPPAEVTNAANPITVDDVFATPLFDYICFRAYTKDQDLTGNAERAAAHRQMFFDTMNGKTTADNAVNGQQVNVKG